MKMIMYQLKVKVVIGIKKVIVVIEIIGVITKMKMMIMYPKNVTKTYLLTEIK